MTVNRTITMRSTASSHARTGPSGQRDRSSRDTGSVLVIVLVFGIIFGAMAIAVARYSQTAIATSHTSLDRSARLAATEGALRLVLEGVSESTTECTTVDSTALTTTIAGFPVTVRCQRQQPYVGENGEPAFAITQAGGLKLGVDNSRVLGDVFFESLPASLPKNFFVEDGDVYYKGASCQTPVTSVPKLNFDSVEPRGLKCVTTGWNTVFPTPVLPDVPDLAHSSIKVNANKCTVFFPGRYTSPPDLDGTKDAYFVSGTYYFDNVGMIKIKDTRVTAGRPGASPVHDDEESLFSPACQDAWSLPQISDTGMGATFVVGGNSRFFLDSDGLLEIYTPPSGDSFVALDAPSNGWAASNGGATNAELIDQSKDHTGLIIHGRVWAPGGMIVLGKQIEAKWTDLGAAATGGQLFGGAILKSLELTQPAPTDGYNVQEQTVPNQFKVRVIAISGNIDVQATADIRPSSEEIAVRSWLAD